MGETPDCREGVSNRVENLHAGLGPGTGKSRTLMGGVCGNTMMVFIMGAGLLGWCSVLAAAKGSVEKNHQR